MPWAYAICKPVKNVLFFSFLTLSLILLSGVDNTAEAQCNCPTNVLINGGFDANGTNGWSASTDFYTGTGFQQCGTPRNAFLAATSQAGWVWQEIDAIPGADYFVSVYMN